MPNDFLQTLRGNWSGKASPDPWKQPFVSNPASQWYVRDISLNGASVEMVIGVGGFKGTITLWLSSVGQCTSQITLPIIFGEVSVGDDEKLPTKHLFKNLLKRLVADLDLSTLKGETVGLCLPNVLTKKNAPLTINDFTGLCIGLSLGAGALIIGGDAYALLFGLPDNAWIQYGPAAYFQCKGIALFASGGQALSTSLSLGASFSVISGYIGTQ